MLTRLPPVLGLLGMAHMSRRSVVKLVQLVLGCNDLRLCGRCGEVVHELGKSCSDLHVDVVGVDVVDVDVL